MERIPHNELSMKTNLVEKIQLKHLNCNIPSASYKNTHSIIWPTRTVKKGCKWLKVACCCAKVIPLHTGYFSFCCSPVQQTRVARLPVVEPANMLHSCSNHRSLPVPPTHPNIESLGFKRNWKLQIELTMKAVSSLPHSRILTSIRETTGEVTITLSISLYSR